MSLLVTCSKVPHRSIKTMSARVGTSNAKAGPNMDARKGFIPAIIGFTPRRRLAARAKGPLAEDDMGEHWIEMKAHNNWPHKTLGSKMPPKRKNNRRFFHSTSPTRNTIAARMWFLFFWKKLDFSLLLFFTFFVKKGQKREKKNKKNNVIVVCLFLNFVFFFDHFLPPNGFVSIQIQMVVWHVNGLDCWPLFIFS